MKPVIRSTNCFHPVAIALPIVTFFQLKVSRFRRATSSADRNGWRCHMQDFLRPGIVLAKWMGNVEKKKKIPFRWQEGNKLFRTE